MKLYKLRLIALVATFLFLLISVVVLYTCFFNRIWHGEVPDKEDQFTQLLLKVIGLFAVHIAVILANYFGAPPLSRTIIATESHWIAFSLVILWHIGFFLFLFFNGQNINVGIVFEKFDANFDKFVTSINFLIAASLVFLFKEREN